MQTQIQLPYTIKTLTIVYCCRPVPITTKYHAVTISTEEAWVQTKFYSLFAETVILHTFAFYLQGKYQ